ncbi:MAG: hypothetical protein JWP97_3384 [Labilithrix sp.]|nr:hypothetical protein [Labilithrix sp.]
MSLRLARSLASVAPALTLAAGITVAVVACGGSVSPVGEGASSSSSSSSSSGGSSSGGSSSGTSGGGSSGSGGTCTIGSLPGDRACVPGTARAGQPISVGVDASEGCLGCFTAFEPCDVTVSGTTVLVTMRTKTCTPAGDVACPPVCASPRTTCVIPPLAAGTYTVSVSGEGSRSYLPARELVVTDGAGETSCALPPSGEEPAPLDGNAFGKSCNQDSDCTPIFAGSQCAQCACANDAVSTSELPAYEAARRARISQCAPPGAPAPCAACRTPVAVCEISPIALVGTCRLQDF